MEQYTRLNKKEISALFNIQNILSFNLLSGGSQNTNYLIESEFGKYVLCICEQQTVEEAKELAKLLQYLEKNNFKTSKTVHTFNGNAVTIGKEKPIIIKEYIEGKIRKNLSPHLLKLVGKEIGKLHHIADPGYLRKQLYYGKEKFVNVKQYAANSEFDIWLNNIFEYMKPFFKLNLPKSFIHGDVFGNNVIISEDESSVTIVDFEESAYYYRIFDIGMAIIGICSEGKIINLEKAKHLLTGYQSEIRLLEDEIKCLKAFTIYAGASMTFWRHRNFNHVNPDPKMFEHYVELKVLVDFMARQANDCFVKLLKE